MSIESLHKEETFNQWKMSTTGIIQIVQYSRNIEEMKRRSNNMFKILSDLTLNVNKVPSLVIVHSCDRDNVSEFKGKHL